MKKLLSLLLAVFMMFTSATAFAQDSPQVIRNNKTGEVTITGNVNPNDNVNIIIEKDNKRYYVDTTSADNEGNYSFNTVIPADREYNAIVSNNGNKQEFQINNDVNEDESVIKIPSLPEGQEKVKKIGSNGEEITVTKDKIDIKIPDIEEEFKVNITNNDKALKLNILDDSNANVKVNLSKVYKGLPKIEAENNDSSLKINENTKINKNSDVDIKLLEEIELDQDAKNKIINKIEEDIINSNKEVNELEKSITLGAEESIVFSDYVEITFKGQAGKEVAYRQDTNISKINKYSDETSGLLANKNEFAYDKNGDLIVKTKHFTDFIVYSTKEKTDNTGNDGNSGNTNPPTNPSGKNYIRLSIDKVTINKGYVISSTKIEFNEGDSVWDVVQDELDRRNISYDYEEPTDNEYKSIYIKSIAGDGEFDHGPQSGWMYCVNGKYPSYGVDKYTLDNGDRVKLRYTTNLGEDLNASKDWNNSDDDSDDDTDKSSTDNGNGEENVTDVNTTEVSTEEETKDNIEDTSSMRFSDEGEISSWAIDAVNKAVELDFISGYNNKISPKDNITRAQFTKLIALLLDLDLETKKIIEFTDVSEDVWYWPYVNTAYIENIIKGNGSLFKPNDNITREQMASIIVRALKLKEKSSNTNIKDIENVSNWALKDVETAYSYKLINGYNGNFNPKQYVTREMAAVIIIRAYDLKDNLKEEDIVTNNLDNDIQKVLDETGNYIKKTVTNPVVGSVCGEWAILGLARSNADVDSDYYDNYYKNVVDTVKKQQEKTSRRWSTKITDTQRVAIALTAIGKDPSNIEGIDLIDYTWNKGKNMPSLSQEHQILGNRQGLNELIFGLITLDLKNSKQPEDASISRDEIINKILNDYQTDEGGFNLRKNAKKADADLTGMTIQALAPYYNKIGYEHVTKAINEAIETLSNIQEAKGGFSSEIADFSGEKEVTAESVAQVIVALCSIDIDPTTDERFIKNGNNPIANLMTFYNQEGGFKHVISGEVNQMATEQAYYALVAYERFVNNKNSLYDMSDVHK